jgi:hypothetical protein
VTKKLPAAGNVIGMVVTMTSFVIDAPGTNSVSVPPSATMPYSPAPPTMLFLKTNPFIGPAQNPTKWSTGPVLSIVLCSTTMS